MTWIVTFYSFKGGVGRTMALVNSAYILAQRGWRVLAVDLDLEAPGMSHFFSDRIKETSGHKGDAINFLLDIQKDLARSRVSPLPPLALEKYVIPLEAPADDSSVLYQRGRLDLMPGALDVLGLASSRPSKDYLARLKKLNLPMLLKSNRLHDRFLDGRIGAAGDMVMTLRNRIKASYDFIFVDSRTGLAEASAVAMDVFDSVVICTGLNSQNISGTRYFAERAGLLDSDLEPSRVVVVGPIPPWNADKVKPRLEEIRRKLSTRSIIEVPLHPRAGVEEVIFVKEAPSEPISEAYEQLAEAIERQILDNPNWVTEVEQALSKVRDGSIDSASPDVARLMARQLPKFRRPSFGTKYRPLGPISTFPTLCAMAGLPAKNIDWENADLFALATAVSARWFLAKKDFSYARRAFTHAWELVRELAEDERLRDVLRFRFHFFYCLILEVKPVEADGFFASGAVETLDGVHGWARNHGIGAVDGRLALLRTALFEERKILGSWKRICWTGHLPPAS